MSMQLEKLEKPEKPSPDFPLFPHASRKWAKKIRGQVKYFGRWDDPDGALAEYQDYLAKQQADDAKIMGVSLSLERAVNLFLSAKEDAKDRGEIQPRSFEEYHRSCTRFAKFIGRHQLAGSLTPTQFAEYKQDRAKTCNLVAVGNEVTRIRTLFKWLHEARLIAEPMHFGPGFCKPSAKMLRRQRRLAGKKMYEPAEIRLILDESGVHLHAMILLAINGGFGNADIATLPLSAVDLDAEWIDYPRPKTEIERRVPLWPETAEAMRKSLARRRDPKPSAEGRFFVRYNGLPWDHDPTMIGNHFRQAVFRSGIKRGGFYWLRRTFETVAGACGDQVAVNAVMGHVDASMAAVYRQEVQDERLIKATDTVRTWLFRSEA